MHGNMHGNLLLSLLLAYYYTGLNMVLYHQAALPMDRPAYVRGPLWGNLPVKFLVGLTWPYACKQNEELGFFSSLFLSALPVTWLTLLALTNFLSGFWAVLLIGAVLTFPIPFVSQVYTGFVSLISGMVLAVLSKLFGARMPGAMERMANARTYHLK